MSRRKALNILKEQEELLGDMNQKQGMVIPGPLSRSLIQGRIDILKWYLTIKSVRKPLLSIDARVNQMLQKQKDMLMDPTNDSNPNHVSKIEIQGRIEALEWLLMR